MRSEREMFELILDTAREDKRVSAVILNGSRADANAPSDSLMDYDIIYVVNETAPYYTDKSWLARFGEPLIFQFPDESDATAGHPVDFSASYTFLMQFADGNRIDLSVKTENAARECLQSGEPAVTIYDRDGQFVFCTSSDEVYRTKAPTAPLFARCHNEFWWVFLYIAKGLCRNRITCALEIFDFVVRPCLREMLSWVAGIDCDFSKSFGKNGWRLAECLPDNIWSGYLATYPKAEIADV